MSTLEVIPTQSDRRKLTAILYADMVGYSRLVGADDRGTLERVRILRKTLFDPLITDSGGRLVQTAGDALLVVFDSIDGALRCAIAIQQGMPRYDGDLPPDALMRFRIGVNIGDVIADGASLYGDGVNVAARLQTICPEGDVCVSRAVRDHAQTRLAVNFEPLGELTLKNIARPVEAFVIRCSTAAVPKRREYVRTAFSRRSAVAAGIASVVAVGGGSIASLRSSGPAVSTPKVQRTALVVGNGRYQHLTPLDNAERDGISIAAALEARGFQVMQRIDTDRDALVQAITDFETTLAIVGGLGCFYYAGSAAHINGADVILPIDANMDWVDIKIRGGVNFTRLSSTIKAKTKRHLIDYGSAIIYSASKGQKASDGPVGRNSPFAQAFLEALNYDEEVSDLFRRVRIAVTSAQDQLQTPYFEDSRSAKTYFNRPQDDPPGVLRILVFDSCRDNPFGATVDAA